MKPATKKKFEEVKDLIIGGMKKEELIKVKFSRSPKKYIEFIERIQEEITEEEKDILEFSQAFKPEAIAVEEETPEHLPVIEEKSQLSVLPLKELLESPEYMANFKQLILNGRELMELLEDRKKIEENPILELPDDFIELKGLRVTSKRIADDVDQAFNEICKQHKEYSKTSLLNFAIWEFVQKYKR